MESTTKGELTQESSESILHEPEFKDQNKDYVTSVEVQVIEHLRKELVESLIPNHMQGCYDLLSKEEKLAVVNIERDENKGSCQACQEFFKILVTKDDFWTLLMKDLEELNDKRMKEKLQEAYDKILLDESEQDIGSDAVEIDEDLDEDKLLASDDSNLSGGERPAAEADEPAEKKAKKENSPAPTTSKESLCDEMINIETRMEKVRITPKLFEPRRYQLELAKDANNGRNCLIVAKTGSGKTYVGILVVEHHLNLTNPVMARRGAKLTQKAEAKISNPCVIVIVPTNLLVQQTYKRYKAYLPLWHIARKSGFYNQNTDLNILAKFNQVIILTPEILRQALVAGSFTLADISLLVLDECHHALRNTKYNQVMRVYVTAKHQAAPGGCQRKQLPQVVGFTASPHGGNKEDYDRVKHNLLTQCANLDMQVLVTVRDPQNKIELAEHVPDPTICNTYAAPRPETDFSKWLAGMMINIEKLLGEYCGSESKSSEQYRSQIMEIEKEATAQQNLDKLKCCGHLKVYNSALQIFNEGTAKHSLNVLEKFYEKVGTHEMDKKLFKIFEDNHSNLRKIVGTGQENPKLEKLKKILIDKKNDSVLQGEQFRGIVFVKTKELAHGIQEYLASAIPELNPAVVYAGRGELIMTRQELEGIVEKFRSGACSLLVSTSVSEEGFDIPECNLVVNYNNPRNLISTVQSRGRVRARRGEMKYVGAENLHSTVHRNLRVELLLYDAIEELQKLSPRDTEEKVFSRQRELLEEWRAKEEDYQNTVRANMNNTFKINCKNCGTFLCHANSIKIHDKHYVNTEQEFEAKIEKRVLLVKDKASKRKHHQGFTHEFHCRAVTDKTPQGCDFKLGNVVNNLLCLGCSKVLFVIDGTGVTYPQWGKVPFVFEKFNPTSY